MKRGQFREDLYYRLNVFPITVPPLRSRRDDISDLARRFVARFAAEEGKRVRGLTSEVQALLRAYGWPGNVRQLENAVFRAVVLADHDELTIAEFPQIAAQVQGFDVRIPPVAPSLPQTRPEREIVRVEVRDPNVLALLDPSGDVRKLEAIEAEDHPLRAGPLPRPDVGDGAQARHRPLDALPEDEGIRPVPGRRGGGRRAGGGRSGRVGGGRRSRCCGGRVTISPKQAAKLGVVTLGFLIS